MLRLRASLFAFLLIASTYAQQVKQTRGNPCDQSRNRLNSETHKFSSDCDAMTYCSNEGICQPKGCRHHEFPFGYDANVTLPAMCPSGQFCPDEEDQCLPIMPPGETCQLNRDDQCQPPTDRPDLEGQLNNHGAMCFQYTCQWANITLGQSCEVENIVYIGYGPGGTQFPNVVSRDRCAPHLWCNAQTSVCEPMVALGQPCAAHKQCETYTCNTDNVCAEPPGTPLKIQIWQYIVTGIAIIFILVSTSIGLFTYHKRTRAKKLREIRAYFKEQTSYRNSIISMHSHARSRLSMYSLHSQADSLAQFGALGTRESFEEEEYNDDRALLGRRSSDEHGMLTGRASEERGLLGRRSSEEHPQHRQDSDDEGEGYVYHPHGGNADHPPLYRPTSRLRDSWNPTEWGARR